MPLEIAGLGHAETAGGLAHGRRTGRAEPFDDAAADRVQYSALKRIINHKG